MRPPIPFAELQGALQSGLPYVALGAVVVAIGLGAIALSRLRSRDPLLRWIGVFALLYGLRLSIQSSGLVGIALGIGRASMTAADRVITYAIPIPYVLFLREWLVGRKQWLSLWLWAEVVFAPLAIVVAIVAGHPDPVDIANNVLVLAGTSVTLVEVWRRDRRGADAAVLKYALFCVLLTNLGFRLGPY